jgi:uncharacterized protein YfaS (alpha-2-macroglobulin family)
MNDMIKRSSRRYLKLSLIPTVLAAVVGGSVALGGPGPAVGPPTQKPPQAEEAPVNWKTVEIFVAEQKFQAALDTVEQLLNQAMAEEKTEDWTRALIEMTQLRVALHGYETAVQTLLTSPWPDDPSSRAILDLYTAQAMVVYAQNYSWEIRKRERVISDEEVDLKRWTHDQIVAAAHSAYGRMWADRSQWGDGPLGDFSRYLYSNSYPPRIRSTLRDAISYLWVDLLEDTSLWRPEQQSEIYRLDLTALADGRTDLGPDDLADTRIHPLERMAAILGDLERWHVAAGRTEAGLEARLSRVKRLHQAVSDSEDTISLREGLQLTLEDIDPQLEWWTMGQATVAAFEQQEEAPDALIRARETALEGLRYHDQGVAAQTCRHIVASIEAPNYAVEGMATDGVGRRSIRITHRNLDTIYFRAYELDLEQIIRTSRDYNLLPGYREVPGFLENQTPIAHWSVDLPPTPDFRDHVTNSIPPLNVKGAYLIVASAREDFSSSGNRRSAFNFILSDLVLIKRSIDGRWEITARHGFSGDPLADVAINLYRADWQKGHRRIDVYRTGPDGHVTIDLDDQSHRYFLLARNGEDLALDQSLSPTYENEPGTTTETLLYTDRSIYRPRQTINWKVLPFSGGGEDHLYKTLANTEITITLHDANHEEVTTQTVTTNAFGSASGSFEIPTGRMLGRWTVESSIGYSSTSIRVEEYKRPTFTVEITDPTEALRLNRNAVLSGSVNYYFGLPVAEGDISWKVTREPVYPRWWSWWRPWGVTQSRVIASGEGRIESDGSFDVAFTPEADEREAEKGVTYRFRLTVDATDPGGETRSADRSFRLGFTAVEATIDLGGGYVPAHQAQEVTILRTDLDATPRSGTGTWRLVGLENPPQTLTPAQQPIEIGEENPFQTAGDRTRPRWNPGYDATRVLSTWKEDVEKAHGTLEHGDDGQASLTIPSLKPGAYRLIYRTEDAFGSPYETRQEFLIGDANDTLVRLPAFLAAEKPFVTVGGTAKLFVHSAFPGQTMVLELYRQGSRFDRRIIRAGRGAEIIEIPVGPELRGGFGATLTLLRDHQLISLNTQVFVPWDDRKLKLEFATFRDRLRPGQAETFRVTVRGAEGETLERGAAEVLASMYDRSLDLFAPYNPPTVDRLYPSLVAFASPRTNLRSASSAWSDENGFILVPQAPYLGRDRLKMLDGYGIGGPGHRGRQMLMKSGAGRSMAMAMPAPMMENLARDAADEIQDAPVIAEEISGEQPPAEQDPTSEIRSNFAETAFFSPHLVPSEDGTVIIEFETPDSVTEWNLWVHAVTRDLRGASEQRQVKTVKELMVRPAVPRFLREGDSAALRVVVNNAGENTLEGSLRLELTDPETGEDLRPAFAIDPEKADATNFSVDPGEGTTLVFPLQVPPRPGMISFKVTATAGDFSDGEIRPLPVLPGRMHLLQSRFAALRDADRRELSFPDMLTDDPSLIHDQLVVSVDAQLFYGVLDALPYLIDYPYECTEQTLNRFLSTGIVTSVFDRYPAVAEMARTMAERDTRLEAWDADDPNRKLALEETPWLIQSRGGDEKTEDLIKVLDPRISDAQRRTSLADLKKVQTSLGAFPWWPGGPPSPSMTLYVLAGFAHALEFEVDVPKDVTVRAWSYMHRHYLDEIADHMLDKGCCWETITWLNFVLSSYPDESWTGGVFTSDDRRQMLNFSFSHWKRHSPRLKAYLAMTLKRAGRDADARLVWDSVMDSAKTDRDLGTYWAPEERAWLWYNDTVETHAVALRALTELDPDDDRRLGLVQWIYLNKKLNHWESTRTTAEVVYALVHYLEHEGQLGEREEVNVTVGPVQRHFIFEPDAFTGKDARVVIPGNEIDPKTMETTIVEKTTPGIAFATATWHFSTEKLPEHGDGDLFNVERTFYLRKLVGTEYVLEKMTPGTTLAVGDQLEVELRIKAAHQAEYVHLRSPRGAGFEPEALRSGWRWDLGIAAYEEIRDSGSNLFFEGLPAGEYTFRYRLRAVMAGTFKVAPAVLQSMYAPEFGAYSAGHTLVVED